MKRLNSNHLDHLQSSAHSADDLRQTIASLISADPRLHTEEEKEKREVG